MWKELLFFLRTFITVCHCVTVSTNILFSEVTGETLITRNCVLEDMNSQCGMFKFQVGKTTLPFRHLQAVFVSRVKACEAVSSPVIRTDATRPSPCPVNTWQWYQVQFIINNHQHHRLYYQTSWHHRGQKLLDANTSLAFVSFSL